MANTSYKKEIIISIISAIIGGVITTLGTYFINYQDKKEKNAENNATLSVKVDKIEKHLGLNGSQDDYELFKLINKLDNLRSNLDDIKKEISSLSSKNISIDKESETLKDKVNSMQTNVNSIEKKFSIINESLGKKISIEKFDNVNKYLSENISDLKNQITKLKGQTNLSDEIKRLQEQFKSQPYNCHWDQNVDSDRCRKLEDKIFQLQLKLDNKEKNQ